MKRTRIIRRALLAAAGVGLCTALVLLLGAASRQQKDHRCSKVLIDVQGADDHLYIDRNDVLRRLANAAGGPLINRSVTQINLSRLEDALQEHKWVAGAELFFDNNDVLHVRMRQRAPVARVFTTTGTSFYIDSSAARMPLMPGTLLRLPTVTGFTTAKRLMAEDSAVLKDIIHIIQYTSAHPFWSAQIGGLHIRARGDYEASPVVGNHAILLGSAEGLEKKLARLFLFYKQVLAKTGFDKYDAVNVQFDGQVIGVKGTVNPVDSAQLARNIAELINITKKRAYEDSLQQVQFTADTTAATKSVVVTAPKARAITPASLSKPLKTTRSKKPQQKPVNRRRQE